MNDYYFDAGSWLKEIERCRACCFILFFSLPLYSSAEMCMQGSLVLLLDQSFHPLIFHLITQHLQLQKDTMHLNKYVFY